MSRTSRRSTRRSVVSRANPRPVEPLEDRRLLSATLTVLANLTTAVGTNPANVTLVSDPAGNLYGTTTAGGPSGDGTVFEVAAGTNAVTTLVTFDGTNGAEPFAGLTIDAAGNLFGTTYSGGATNNGTVFEIAAGSRAFSTLATFDSNANSDGLGAAPQASLYEDGSGNLFGTTYGGGTSNLGTVFEVAAGSHALTTLASFDGTNTGSNSTSPLTPDAAGNLYGTTLYGGADNDGTVFKIAAGSHAFSVYATFTGGAGGRNGWGGVVIDAAGNMYGTTQHGGTTDDGMVFEIAAGTQTVTQIATFLNGSANGYHPLDGLIIDKAGNLFGTTDAGPGTVFEVSAPNHTLTTLATFVFGTGPWGGFDPLYADPSGNVYGLTQYGGPDDNSATGASGFGTVFQLTGTGFVAPTITATAPGGQSATAGTAKSISLGSFAEQYATAPYTVTVNWGDGTAATTLAQASPGTIAAQSHTFPIVGTTARTDTVTVTVTDSAGHTSAASAFAVTVAAPPATITVTAAGSATATAGAAQSFSLGSFAETNATGPYTVTVNWGDSTAATTFTAAAAGTIAPQSHSYATSGAKTGTVTVTDSAGHTSNAATFGVTVNPMPVTSVTVTPPAAQSATVGVARSFPLGSFAESNATGPYTVTVSWGDSSAATTFSVAAAGTITAQSHTYAAVGSDTATITVTDAGGHASAPATFAVTVGRVPVAAITVTAPAAQSATAGAAETFTLGSFTASNATAPFTVTVNWGDGSAATTFSAAAAGAIAGQPHLYAAATAETATVTVTDAAGHASNAATFTVAVQAPSTQVTVHVFNDADQSGTSTAPIVGRQVFADLDGDNVREPNEPSAFTGPDGSALLSLAGVTGSTCLIAEVVPDGVQQTYPAVPEVTVTVANPAAVTFGNLTLAPVTVASGTLFDKYALASLPASPTATGVARAVTEADGTLVVVGTGASGPFVAHYFFDGQPDLHFGTAGVATLANATAATHGLHAAVLTGVAVEPDGDIVVVGTGTTAGGVATSFDARLLPNGTVDATFGATFDSFPQGGVRGVTLMVDGSLLTFGNTAVNGSSAPAILDLSGNTGLPVATFGTNGLATASNDLGSTLDGSAAVNPAGGVDLLASDGALVTFAATGSLVSRSVVPTLAFTPTALAVQADGKVLVGGALGSVVFVARINADGTLDTTFGTGGTASSTLGTGGTVGIGDVGELPDGTVLLTGTYYAASSTAGQCFCQGYDGTTGAATFGVGTDNPLLVSSDVTLAAATGTGVTLGARLVLPSGVLPTITASSAADVALPAQGIHTGGVGFIHGVSIISGVSVADIAVEQTAPSATFQPAATVSTVGTAPEVLEVRFTDAVALNLNTFRTGNLSITPGGSSTPLLATFLSILPGWSAQDLTAQYELPPVGGVWDAGDDGAYAVSLVAGQVKNTARAAPAKSLGSFAVAVAAATTPTATLTPIADVTAPGTATLAVTVTYTGASAPIAASSISSQNLSVTGPTGAALVVTAAAAGTASGNSLSVTYTVAAPASAFGTADNGTYTVALLAGQVTDTAGTAVAAGTLGTFTVRVGAIPTAVTVTPLVPAAKTGIVVNFTATVSGVAGAAAATATGTASFYSNGTVLLGTAPVVGGSATFSTALLPAGTDAVTAVYDGDATYAGSTSAAATVTLTGPGDGAPVLAPSVAATVLPVALVAGAKHRLVVPVSITNHGGAAKGTVTITLYASTDANLDSADVPVAPASVKTLTLKAGATKKISLALAGLPSSLADGTYYLLAQVTDPSGFAQTAATAGTVTVAAPFVAPAVSFTKVTGATVLLSSAKAKGSAVLSLTNAGNVAIGGPVTITLTLTANGVPTTIQTVVRRLAVPAGKTKSVSIPLGTVPALAAGSYTLSATVQTAVANGAAAASASAVCPTLFTVA